MLACHRASAMALSKWRCCGSATGGCIDATEAAGPFYHVLMPIAAVSAGFPAVDLPLLSMMGGMQLPCCYVAQGVPW